MGSHTISDQSLLLNTIVLNDSLAPALFQKIMDTILQGVPNTICYLDDILVTGRNETKHLRNLEEVLKRLQQNGLKGKPEKCEFLQPLVEYLGHRIGANGVHTTMRKVETIKSAPTPQDVQHLWAFLLLRQIYTQPFLNTTSAESPAKITEFLEVVTSMCTGFSTS